MDDFDVESYREASLQANSNQQYIDGQVEYLLRTLMRGVGSQRPSDSAHKAAEQLNHIVELVRRFPDFDLAASLAEAMYGIANFDSEDSYDAVRFGAARSGLMYIAEATAHDNAARGRASKRLADFEMAIKTMDEFREERRRRWR